MGRGRDRVWRNNLRTNAFAVHCVELPLDPSIIQNHREVVFEGR